MKYQLKRTLSCLCACTMLLSALPASSFAVNAEGNTDGSSLSSAVAESLPANAVVSDADEITLYFLNTEYEQYVSIPEDFAQSYQITLDGDYENVSYSVNSDRVTVSSTGLVKPKLTTAWTLCYAGAGEFFERTYGDEGVSTVTVTADDEIFKYKIKTVSYGYNYCEQIIQKWMDENITDSMTEMEQLEKVCEFVCSYDYKASCVIGGIGMVLEDGGDCHGSTSTVNYMCQQLGMAAWTRDASGDPGAGLNHTNSIIKFSDDSAYIVDCGFNEAAPRFYSIQEYSGDMLSSGDYIYETMDDGTLKITEYGGSSTSVIVIPQEIDGITVTAIGEKVFAEHSEITSLIMPDTITSIGNNCFRQCSSLAYIEVSENLNEVGNYAFDETEWYDSQPDGVVYLGTVAYCWKGDVPENTHIQIREGTTGIAGYAFYSYNEGGSYSSGGYTYIKRNCNNVTSVEVPESVEIIGDSAFEYCDGLERAVLHGGSIIKMDAFADCTSLTDVTLSEKLTKIESFAFNGCTALKELVVPESVKEIGGRVFEDCTSLESIQLPETVKSFGGTAFSGCVSLKSVVLPKGTYALTIAGNGDDFFSRCESLVSVVIPEGITSLNNSFSGFAAGVTREESLTFQYSISGCKSLEQIDLPSTILSISNGGEEFYGCESLKAINISEDSKYFCSVDGVLYNKSMTELIKYPAAKEDEIFTVPESVTKISKCAFSECSNLKEVVLSDGIKTIPTQAFANASIQKITLPKSLETIEDYAFQGCASLKSVTLPESVKSIGVNPFIDCASLTQINTAEENSNFRSMDGVLFSSEMVLISYPIGADRKEYTIPDGTVRVAHYAFKSCESLETASFPDTLYRIDVGAFLYCINLRLIKMPERILNTTENTALINQCAFYGCESLTSVSIPDGMEEIYAWSFKNCANLKAVGLADSVTGIGYDVFGECKNITDIYYGGSENDWENIGSVTETTGAWSNADGLKRIGIYTDPTFHYNTSLPDDIPESTATLKGDVNIDGVVDVLDIIVLNKNLLGEGELTEQGKINADVNKDGKPGADDSLSILKYIVKIIDKLSD